MKVLKILIPITALIFLVACTTGGDEPAFEPESISTTPPLQEVTPENPTTLPDPTSAPQPDNTSQPESPPGDDGSGTETGSVSPAEVDLSQVTSQPPTNATPQEAPQPGVPDPKSAAAHQVSQDLAARLGIDVGDVTTVSVEDVEWSDSSLGCPAPGMMYLTVITPGYLITLEGSGAQYTYHTDQRGNYVLCGDDGQPVAP